MAFPLVFAALWFGVVWLIGRLSGWHALANRFPDRPEAALKQFNWRTGRMGILNSRFKGVLQVGVCPSGLRLSLMWLFAAGNKPFLVPWDHMSVRHVKGMFYDETQLQFGRPEVSTLTILRSFADEIAAAAPKGRWKE